MPDGSDRIMPIARAAAFAVLAAAIACGDAATGPLPGEPLLASARYPEFGAWSVARNLEVTSPGAHPDFNLPTSGDGCPSTSRDGTLFFIASDRPGGLGALDIWVATRATPDDPWGAPVNVGAPINSAAADFCPMLDRDGHTFYFVSSRSTADAHGNLPCGGTDIYVSRRRADGSFDAPRNLGCAVNSAFDEAGPVPVNEPGRGPVLYFSSVRPGGPNAGVESSASPGDSDVYVSEWHGGAFRSPSLVPGINTAAAEGQPYVRADALELFFFSNRPSSQGNDIYVASRERASDAWSTPVNLGPAVNSPASETRPSLSADARTLYFGSTRDNSNDVYAATREAFRGRDR